MKKNREAQHGECTLTVYKVRGTYQENKDTFFKTKTVAGGFSSTGISHEERE